MQQLGDVVLKSLPWNQFQELIRHQFADFRKALVL
jgi:hypothetical protein